MSLTDYAGGALDMSGVVLEEANKARVEKRYSDADLLLALWSAMRERRHKLCVEKYPHATELEKYGAGVS